MQNKTKKYFHYFLRDFNSVIDYYLTYSKKIFFIQVGANDGKMSDPLNKFIKRYNKKITGIMIEPQKVEFERLKKMYKNYNFKFENIAISSRNQKRKLYKVRKDKLMHDWQRGIATLVPNKGPISIMNRKDVDYEFVDCITFKDLLKKHKVKSIDLLQIDVEGYDFEIIKLINFKDILPKIIHYENVHLKNKEREECNKYLHKRGYVVMDYGDDTIAFLCGLFNIKSVTINRVV